MQIDIDYKPNNKQELFHSCNADECVYGGAKGGGKSCALVMEALAYGLENPRADMYIFRETYDDLEANIIKEWKAKVSKELYEFNETKHFATLINGTTVKFRYIRNFIDAESYQGRSMDWIGVDELTKHEKRSIQILLSCLRSAKGFKPRFRATCNPGGIGHAWVKEMYIDATNYGLNPVIDELTGLNRVFIPAKVYDNTILVKNDPNYIKRLENLPENQKKAFLYGDWDIFEGQYFTEFKRDVHVIQPFVIPEHWNRYIALDYGLDMLACLWIAIDEQDRAYVYKELYQNNLIISEAAARILEVTDKDKIKKRYAPPDLWNRRQETGDSAEDIFRKNGVVLHKSNNNRVMGWYAVKEHLKIELSRDEQTGKEIETSKLKIFSNCTNLIRTLPQLQHDERNPNDVSNTPHELTHINDALRGFCIERTHPTKTVIEDELYEINKAKNKYRDKVKGLAGKSASRSFINYGG